MSEDLGGIDVAWDEARGGSALHARTRAAPAHGAGERGRRGHAAGRGRDLKRAHGLACACASACACACAYAYAPTACTVLPVPIHSSPLQSASVRPSPLHVTSLPSTPLRPGLYPPAQSMRRRCGCSGSAPPKTLDRPLCSPHMDYGPDRQSPPDVASHVLPGAGASPFTTHCIAALGPCTLYSRPPPRPGKSHARPCPSMQKP